MTNQPPDGYVDTASGPPDGYIDQPQQGQSPSYWKSAFLGGTPVSPQTIPQTIDYGLRKGLQIGADVINYPFEKTGEAIRTAIGGGPMRPSSLATDTGFSEPSQQPPMNFISVPRKAIEASLLGITKGPQAGIGEFNRTTTTPVEGLTDAAVGLAGMKYAPEVTNAPLNAAGKIVSPLLKGAGFVGKKLFSATTGVSEPALAARYGNSNLPNSPNVTDLAQKLPQSVSKLSNQISQDDIQALKTLSNSYTPPELGYTPEDRAIPKDQITGILKSVKKELSVYGGGLIGKAAKQASSAVDGLIEDIQGVGKYVGGKVKSLLGVNSSLPKNNYLPETTVKGIIQSLDSNINWADETAKPLNSALENARVQLDQILKDQNPAYREAMKPVNEKMKLLKNLQQQFNIKSAPGQGYIPGTATEGNLSNVLRNNKSVVQDTLAKLGQYTGENYLNDLKNAQYNREFQSGMRAQGSRRTLFGGAVGTGVGHFTGSPTLGGMAGAGTGFMLDTQGGPIAAALVDAASKLPKISQETMDIIKQVSPIAAMMLTQKQQPTAAPGATYNAPLFGTGF